MGLSVFTGSFILSGSTGNQSITGVGFEPKLVIFSGSLGSSGAHAIGTYGFAASSTKRWAIGFRSTDNLAASSSDRSFKDNQCIAFSSGSVADYILADFVSNDSDGFTINIGLRGGGTRHIQFMCLGGTDLDVDVGTFVSNTSLGNQSITGIGFQPKCLLFGNSVSSSSPGNVNSIIAMLGAATSSTSRWATTMIDINNVGTSRSDRYYNTDRCIVRPSGTPSVVNSADFVSNDSDGFTIDITDGTSARIYGYVALGGSAQYHVNSFASATSTGDQQIAGLGFKPECEMFVSDGHTSLGFTTDAKMQLGFAVSSTQRGVISYNCTDNVGTMQTSYYQDTANCIRHISGGTPTSNFVADMKTQDSDGFTLDVVTADANARTNLFLAIGAAATGGILVAIPSGLIALSGLTPTANVTNNKTISVPNGSLSFTGQTPTILIPQAIDIPFVALGLNGLAPTVSTTGNKIIGMPVGTLSFSGLQPIIVTPNNVSIPVGNISLTGLIPTILAGGSISIDIPTAALELNGLTPSVLTPYNIDIPSASLTLAGQAPNVTNSVSVEIPVGGLAITGYAVTAVAPNAINIPEANLVMSGYAPSIGAPVEISIPLGSMSLDGLSPNAVITENTFVNVPVGSLGITGYSPAVTATADQLINIPVGNISFVGYAPAIIGNNQIGYLTATITIAQSVSASILIDPSVEIGEVNINNSVDGVVTIN